MDVSWEENQMALKTRLLGTCAVVVITSTCAFAQDWSGFYGGATIGYTSHDTTHTFSNGAPTGSSDPDGGLLGGFLGYAFQSGQTVYGAELDIEASNASGTFANLTGPTSGGKAELNWQGSIRGVLGFAGNIGPNPALFYGTLGWASGDFDFYGGPAAAFAGNRYSKTLDGWTAGVGIDTRFSNNLSLRTEYRYTDYGTARGTLAPGFPAVTMPVSVEQHAVRIGIRMDF